ncbi:MAG: hypothetical protein K2G24_03445 [Muribaculaceae bacterium]|nr:hypothetical protein [Muribaculaceae bacterium]
MSNFSNQAAVDEALKSLHRYIRSMHISVELPEIDKNALEEYFNCEDNARNATFDKFIKAAAVEAIYNDPDIPNKYKAKVAKRAAQELVDAFRGAKVEYEFAAGKYGSGNQSVRRYEREKKMIKLCRKAAFLDGVKKNLPKQLTKIGAKLYVTTALTAGGLKVGGFWGAAVGFATGIAVDAVCILIPRPIKDKIRQKCGDMAQKAASIVKTIGNQITATPAFKKAKAVVDTYVAPIVRPVYEKARELVTQSTTAVCNAAKKGWKLLKSVFA